MKNEFKKEDSNGNPIPTELEAMIQFWGNLDVDKLNQVKDIKSATITFRIEPSLKKKFESLYQKSTALQSFVRYAVNLKNK